MKTKARRIGEKQDRTRRAIYRRRAATDSKDILAAFKAGPAPGSTMGMGR